MFQIRIETMTDIIQQRTPEWQEQRKLRITGSRLGAVLGLSPWQKPKDVLREMVRQYHGAESEFVGGPHIDHGVNHEKNALLCFMRKSGLNVEECGFFAYGDFMGASPDGLTSDGGILELKVPYSLRKGGEFKSLSDQPQYNAQVQMEMIATGRNHGYFAQYIAPCGDPLAPDYVPEKMKIEHIELDPLFLDKNLEKINEFYRLLLSELDNKEHLEPLRTQIDTDRAYFVLSEIDRLRVLQKESAEAEKALLDELVKMADGKNAEVHGRKLTLVKKQGSISYAKAIKELLPNADLEKWRGKETEGWRLT